MNFKFDVKKMFIVILLSLVLVTIFNSLLLTYWNVPQISTGPSFFILFISVFIIYLFVAIGDGKIDRTEIFTMIMIAVFLVIAGWALKSYFPEIFSALPSQTKQFFSALGV